MTSRLNMVFTLVLSAISCCPAMAGERPNVLFIAVDDLNDWLGCLDGHPQAKTPHMDRLAPRGVLFTNDLWAAPGCHTPPAVLLSGQRRRHGPAWKRHDQDSEFNGRHVRTFPGTQLLEISTTLRSRLAPAHRSLHRHPVASPSGWVGALAPDDGRAAWCRLVPVWRPG